MINKNPIDFVLNMYQAVLEITPENDCIEVHKGSELILKYNLDDSTARNFVSSVVNNLGSDSYQEQIFNFLNIAQLSETFKVKKYAELEIKSKDSNWYRLAIIPKDLNEDESAKTLLLCIQGIDLIKRTEEKHNTMVSAMSHIFDALFFIDLENNLVGVINSKEDFFELKGRINDAHEFVSKIIKQHVRKDYESEMTGFLNIDTIASRLVSKDVISDEYVDIDGTWFCGQIICAARKDGECVSALLGFRDISEEKERTETKDNIIHLLTANYRNIFSVSLSTGKVKIFRLDESISPNFGQVLSFANYDDIARVFKEEVVYEEDRDLFNTFCTIEGLSNALKNKINHRITYRIKEENVIHYYEIRFETMSENADSVILAIKNVDNTVELQNEVKRGYDAYVTLHKLIKSGMWSQFYDEEGKPSRIVWSDEFRRMIGYESTEDFPDTNESFLNIIHPDDRDRVVNAILSAVHDNSGSTLFDENFRLQTKHQGIRWFRATGDSSRNLDGTPYCFYGVFFDVTDQFEREQLEKERESALDEAKAYQDAMNSIHGAVNSGKWSMTYDEDGYVNSIVWGEDLLGMLGYKRSTDLNGTIEKLLKIVHQEDAGQLQRLFTNQVENTSEDQVYNVEFRLLTKKNGYGWFQSVSKVVLNDQGKPVKTYGLLFDINEKKKNEERLTLQHQIVEALSLDFSEIRLLDLTSDKSYKIKHSGEMYEFDGQDAQKYSEEWNQALDSFAYEEDIYEILDAISAQRVLYELSYKDEYSYNYRINLGGEHHFQIKYIKLANDKFGKNYVVSGIRCIDDIIETEKQQKMLLQNALASAERANRAKTVFLNSMSHDIRTPMNAIVGFAALANVHIDNKKQVQDYLEKIKVSSNHLLSLINDVLDMSRIESGKVKIDAKEVNLPEALHEIRSIIQSDVSAKRLELQIDCVDVVNEKVICDKLRLNQVLLNLVSNSIKFTPAGGVITIKVVQKTCVVTNRANFEFIVKDTGIGMSREFLEHIFEPFTREETSTVSGIQGTGLGMAITKNIVDMMHGTISVKSEPGKGSEFTIALSFDVSEEAVSTEPIEEYKNVRALVVDDDMDACFSVSKMLSALGMRAEWTTSGKEAIARAKYAMEENDEFGIYILDWLIPDMNGLEIARRIRTEAGDKSKIFIMSSYDWTDVETEALEAKVEDFFSKPLFMSELREALTSSNKTQSGGNKENVEDDFTGRRILIVEDNDLNREIAVGILETVGFETETAADGNIAVDMVSKAKEGYYDIILMDIQMPTMNGYEATKIIRKLENESLRNIPIIAMTANAFDEDRKKAINAGMNGHVAKPFEAKALFKTIRGFLN
ncbi:MAG: response regulator [Lachnospiraceae bacterium]|nr:response regulator [Lachnospiraceae bacterium]